MQKSTQLQKNNDSPKVPHLVVKKHYTLDFTSCEITEHPTDKKHFKLIIDTLKDFAEDGNFDSLASHKLENKGTGKNSEHMQLLVKSYPKLKSVDVGSRNGKDGKWRMLYYIDENNSQIAHIVNCFIDDH